MDAPTSHDLDIRNLGDVAVLQRIQDTFAKAMGVAAVTVDRNGTPITCESNFQPICRMIRSTPAGLARCMKSDAQGGLAAYGSVKPEAYVCLGGLVDVAAPITIEGEYIGCILCGQVVLTEDRENFIKDIVRRNVALGLPYKQVLAAAEQIPSIPKDRLDAAVEMLMLMANHIIEIGMTNLTQTRLLKEAEEKATAQAALQNAQLRALQSQINPHFLFNSLTLVGYTALDEDAPRTEEIAYTLSELLRYSLRNTATMVALREEVEMVGRYLAIQQMHFGERLTSRVRIDPALHGFQLPCMLLQPLVENAIVHGVESVTRCVTVELNASRENGTVLLEIADDGPGIDAGVVQSLNANMPFVHSNRKRPSLGLQSVVRRLAEVYGEQFKFKVESSPGKGFRIMLFLPISEN
jgi:two-component system, LytTR family, sensor kinase